MTVAAAVVAEAVAAAVAAAARTRVNRQLVSVSQQETRLHGFWEANE